MKKLLLCDLDVFIFASFVANLRICSVEHTWNCGFCYNWISETNTLDVVLPTQNTHKYHGSTVMVSIMFWCYPVLVTLELFFIILILHILLLKNTI